MQQRRVLLVMMLCLLLSSVALLAQAQDSPWQVTAAAPLVYQSGVGLRTYPAPDGQHIAYERAVRLNGHFDRFFCAGAVSAPQEVLCLEPAEDLPRGYDVDAGSFLLPAAWSADSSRVAVAGQPLTTLLDTDLWIMDLAAGEWLSLSDDGYTGALAASAESAAPPADVVVEVQPAWSPDGTQLAVVRALTGEDGAVGPATLSLLAVDSGEVSDLVPLPGAVEGVSDAGAVTSLVWSPDGTQLAFSLRHSELDAGSDGLWLLDVESGATQPLLAWEAAGEAWQGIFPAVTPEQIGPLAWSPEGSRILFWLSNPTTTPVSLWAFWVDVASGAVTALPLPATPNDTGARRGVWPFQAAWSPDGAYLIAATNGLHPDEPRDSLDPQNRRARVGVRMVDVAAGTQTFLGLLPSGEAAPFYLAAWGPEGQVILNGYHLVVVGE